MSKILFNSLINEATSTTLQLFKGELKAPTYTGNWKLEMEITNRHRNNPFSRHLSICIATRSKKFCIPMDEKHLEFLSVFHNFQRYKIAQRLRNVEVIHKEERNITHNHLFPAHFPTFLQIFQTWFWCPSSTAPHLQTREHTHTHTRVLLEPLGSRWQGVLLRYQLQFISSSCLQRCLEGIQSLFSMGESESGLEVSGTQNSPISRPLCGSSLLFLSTWLD